MGRHLVRVAVAIAAVVVLAGCWLEPGFDAEQSGFNALEQGLTPANVAGLHRVWTAQFAAAVNAPVVDLNGVYVTTSSATGTAALVSRATGVTTWSKPIAPGPFVSSTGAPLRLGSVLYTTASVAASSGGQELIPFDAATGAAVPDPGGGASSGVITNRGALIVSTGGYVRPPGIITVQLNVIDTAGTNSWSTILHQSVGGSFPTPTGAAIGADRVVIGDGTNIEAWSLAPPANCASGVCPPSWSIAVPTAVTAHPVLSPDDSTAYAVSGASVLALNAATGALGWTGTLGAASSAPPSIANGYVYVPTSSGELDVFPAPGCGRATCTPLWTANAGSAITGAPAVVGGGLVDTGSADGSVHAYPATCGAPTCSSLWTATTGSAITGGPIPDLGAIYVGTQDGRLVAYGL